MAMVAASENFIDVDGIRIRYLDAGSGPPLVLLHGLGQSSTAWRRSIDALTLHHRVLAPDLPGFGGSAIPPDAPFGPRYFGRVVARFLANLELDRVDAVGHSAGALALCIAALDSPRSYRRIVLVDPVGFAPTPDNILGTAATSLFRLVVAVPRTRPLTKALYSTAFFDPQKADDETIEEIGKRYADPLVKVAARRSFANHFDFCRRLEPFHRRLAELQVPTLVIWGRDDRLFRASDAAVAKRVLRQVRVEVIEKCGHCPQIEQPARFTDLVLEFLAAK
jgi:pimeloyl-ACP methyl ester carboxylesterase